MRLTPGKSPDVFIQCHSHEGFATPASRQFFGPVLDHMSGIHLFRWRDACPECQKGSPIQCSARYQPESFDDKNDSIFMQKQRHYINTYIKLFRVPRPKISLRKFWIQT
jgi:hypothetical protein